MKSEWKWENGHHSCMARLNSTLETSVCVWTQLIDSTFCSLIEEGPSSRLCSILRTTRSTQKRVITNLLSNIEKMRDYLLSILNIVRDDLLKCRLTALYGEEHYAVVVVDEVYSNREGAVLQFFFPRNRQVHTDILLWELLFQQLRTFRLRVSVREKKCKSKVIKRKNVVKQLLTYKWSSCNSACFLLWRLSFGRNQLIFEKLQLEKLYWINFCNWIICPFSHFFSKIFVKSNNSFVRFFVHFFLKKKVIHENCLNNGICSSFY